MSTLLAADIGNSHTVLGLVEVQAPEYQPALDLLQACRAPARGGQGAERRQGDA